MIPSDVLSWARDELRARFALAHICDPADRVVTEFSSREGAGAALVALLRGNLAHRSREVYELRWARCDLDAEWKRAHSSGVRIVSAQSPEWPRQLTGPGVATPHLLWVAGRGHVADVTAFSVAIVGARACTHYGGDVARSWAADLATAGVTVISGGAFGIDAAAHAGALAVDGPSVLVTAGGVDAPYPRAHQGLFHAIQRRGCVVSESPLGSSVRRARFLTRNRLIAGMAKGTVVVEAARRSGSLSTARYAEEMGRVVMAVPGPVTSAASSGCHEWIAERRAELAMSAGDVLALVTGTPGEPRAVSGRDLPPRLALLLDAFPTTGTVTIDDLIAASGLSRPHVERGVQELAAMAHLLAGDGRWSRHPR